MVRDGRPDLRLGPRARRPERALEAHAIIAATRRLRYAADPRHVTMPMRDSLPPPRWPPCSWRCPPVPQTSRSRSISSTPTSKPSSRRGGDDRSQLRPRPASQGRDQHRFGAPRTCKPRLSDTPLRAAAAGLRGHRKRRRDQDCARGGRQAARVASDARSPSRRVATGW